MRILPWSTFNPVSNSVAAKATILIPLIGYLVLFNETVVKYLNLVAELGGPKVLAEVGVSPRLLLIYFGLCMIAAAVTLYSIFCPSGIKHYGSVNFYVGNVQDSVKMFALDEYENALESSEYEADLQVLQARFDRQVETVPTAESQASYSNGLLRVYYEYLNWSAPLARYLVAFLYAVGFVCLSIPSAGVFYRVMRILCRVIGTQASLLF